MNVHSSNNKMISTGTAGAGLLTARGASRELRESSAEAGATPSNRAPANPIFTPLRFGIDSLYLSFKGVLFDEMAENLSALKIKAQSDDETISCNAQLEIGGHTFEVTDKATRGFSYGLRDNAFFIKLSKRSKSSMPFASVQISSEYLSHVGHEAAVEDLRVVIDSLGRPSEAEKISRLDPFVDFTTSEDLSHLTSTNFVCRSKKIGWHELKPNFTGFDIGLGGNIAFRLYDKTNELKVRPRPYLPGMWKAAGWDGKATIWRAEFETKRPFLKTVGINEVRNLKNHVPTLWEHLTSTWFRLVVERKNDRHRERWEELALWSELRKAFSHEPISTPLQKFDFSRVPSDDYLYKNGLAGITSFMARENIKNPAEAIQRLVIAADHHHKLHSNNKENLADYFEKKVKSKKRRYNKIVESQAALRNRFETGEDHG